MGRLTESYKSRVQLPPGPPQLPGPPPPPMPPPSPMQPSGPSQPGVTHDEPAEHPATDHGETVLFSAVPAATPLVWGKWLITLGIYEIFRRHTVFLVTSRRVVVRQGVIHRNERSLPVGRIQDISTRRGMLTGSVELSSAGGGLGVESFGPLWNPSVKRMAGAIEDLVANG